MTGTGYHNDQFFNLGASGEPGSAQKVDGSSTFAPSKADNQIFRYPDNQIRTEDHTGRRNQTLKKGYIRSMLTSNSGTAVAIRKCQFQFNPTTIQQSVSANESMLNFLQQDPAQYAQPMPGSVNFSFTLFFDRSMEVNNAGSSVVSNPNVDSDLWRDNSPGQVGVLHDLSAFFGVVGQGLNKSQLDYMKGILEDSVTAEANASSAEDSITKGQEAVGNIDSFLSINMGNSAFLLPVPVRVVFSSLYIVEGLVKNTTVAFTKFSSTLVPMQCSVTVTMEAKYIGFAKRKTFFTDVLEQREKLEFEAKQEDAARKKALVEALSKACNKVSLSWFLRPGDTASYTTSTPAGVLQSKNTRAYLGITLPGAKGNDTAVTDELDSASGTLIEFYGSYTMYKAPSALNNFRGSLEALVSQNDLTPLVELSFFPITSPYKSGRVESTKEWKKLYSFDVSFSPYVTTNGYSGPIVINSSTDWFIAKVTVDIDVTTNGERIRGKGTTWRAFGPGTGFDETVIVSPVWPKIVVPDSAITSGVAPGYVPAGNAATDSPPPGDTSKVGAPVVSTKPAPKPGQVVRQ